VRLYEAQSEIGGAARTLALTLPGFLHDHCSAIHPLAAASPFFRTLELERHGLVWIHPDAPLAHPLDDGSAALLERSLEATASRLGADAAAYRRLLGPLVGQCEALLAEVLAPPLHLPARPLLLARFGLHAIRSARDLARAQFQSPHARALFAGLSAHSFLELEQPLSAAFGLVLAVAAHAVGWPMPRSGAQAIPNCLAGLLRADGGQIETRHPVESLEELPGAQLTLLDVTPRQLLSMAGKRLDARYARALERYRYGPGVFKIDWALSAPIPWKNAECARAGTVHLGGSLDEIAEAERLVACGHHPERPFVLLAQPSLFDPTRAPKGCHTAWAYCHVPNGSERDMTRQVEAQVERFAPGFGQAILARSTRSALQMQHDNANCVGGDINGGLLNLRQFLARPVLRPTPYATPLAGVYLCSASTPPGGGVHGMCGFHAARAAWRGLGAWR
jgi:phytoene dehydrogenase-like protein